MTALLQRKYTVQEYLQQEATKASDEQKSEFFDGKIFTMPLVTENHDIITGNLYAHFWNDLRKKGYRPYTGDVRVKLTPTRYAYPDVTLVQKPPQFAQDEFYNLLNPLLIVEVLSKSTEAKDRGLKFRAYREIPSLQEYLLVSQTEFCIESFYKNATGQWLVGETYTSEDAIFHFQSIDFKLGLKAIYEEVKFEETKQ